MLLPLFSWSGSRKDQQPVLLESLLPVAADYLSPAEWHQGMPFVLLRESVGLTLIPEIQTEATDSIGNQGVWTYDSMVSEEDWMGQQLLQLRFLSPQGRAYRFSTGRPMNVISEKNYQPVLGCLYPLQLIQDVDEVLRARTLFILINDDRVTFLSDSDVGLTHEKFVPVRIDSVTSGNELAPLAVHFHREGTDQIAHEKGFFYASLPGSRETGTSTPLNRFLALSDPYQAHPDITPEIWELIKKSSVQLDMTAEEVRLSLGRPSKVEKIPSRNGFVEYWYYSNNRVLQIWDGRLFKIGVL